MLFLQPFSMLQNSVLVKTENEIFSKEEENHLISP